MKSRKSRSKSKSRSIIPTVAISQDLKRETTNNSYAELEINPAPDIFHNDEENLRHEMIDQSKAVNVMSQLKPVITKARN